MKNIHMYLGISFNFKNIFTSINNQIYELMWYQILLRDGKVSVKFRKWNARQLTYLTNNTFVHV